MSKLTLAAAAAAVAALALVASGLGAARLSPLPASSCGPLQYEGGGSPQYLIASDLPLQGASRTQTVEMGKAVAFILARHGYKAGKYTVGYQACDDATAQAGKWDSGKCSANGNAYARNPAVVGVVGTFNSGCAEIIIPILNRAPGGPVAMISPANTYVGLTHGGPGTAPGEPSKYYPSGKRNYVRIVAADDFQGAADAMLAKQLGVRKVYILNDKEAYGLGVATNFRNAAKSLGLSVAGFDAWDPKASSYEALATKIAQTGAQGVFVGGLIDENGGKLIKDLRGGLGNAVHLMAPDGFTPVRAVVAGAGKAAEGLKVSIAGVPNEQLQGTGKAFVKAFRTVVHKDADPYSVYAAQAAEVLLQAIAKSDGTRASVAANLFRTKIVNGILGSFALNANGDTTSNPITVYQVVDGRPATFKVITPPPSLVKIA